MNTGREASRSTYSNETAVGVLVVQDGSPVIGVVLLELASRASGYLREIETGVHGQVKADAESQYQWSMGDDSGLTHSKKRIVRERSK